MMPAAKHFDPVIGVDIHIIQPPGPVPPVPIPHPFIGFLFDPFDYVPNLGATIYVNGVPRAIAGTTGKTVPGVHFPIGGTFVKPPANECEMFMGSSTVHFDGDPASYMALPALSCQDIGMVAPFRINPKKKTKVKSLVLPTSVVLPIPLGLPVFIGGPPTISLMAIGMKLGMSALGKAMKKLAGSSLGRRVSAAFKKARQRLFRNMRPGFLKCNILRAEPVNTLTGEVVVEQEDFRLPNRIPIQWVRSYRSGSTRKGLCGHGWETPADARLALEADGSVVFHDGAWYEGYSGTSVFGALPKREPLQEPVDGAILWRTDDRFLLRVKGGLTYTFPLFREGQTEVLVERIQDSCGNWVDFARHSSTLLQIVDSSGTALRFESRDDLIRSISLHSPGEESDRRLVAYSYSPEGDLVDVESPLKALLRFEYREHKLVRQTDRSGVSFYYEYDQYSPSGTCIRTYGEDGLYTYKFEYEPTLWQTRITDSLGNVTVLTYDEDSVVISETDPLGGITSYESDDVGRTTAVVDPAGNRTEYTYDARGNLVQFVRADGSKFTTEFDEHDCPIALKTPNGHLWYQQWDHRGLLIGRTSPTGGTTRYRYDDFGGLVSWTDPLGGQTRLTRNALGHIDSITNPLGRITRFSVDPFGNRTSSTDPAGNVIRFIYNEECQLTRAEFPDGTGQEYFRDLAGRVVRFRDENNNVSEFTYSGLGEIAQCTRPDGSVIRCFYDEEERLTSVINGRGEKHSLVRDGLGRVIEEIDYWGRSHQYKYDTAGRLRELLDPLGRVTQYQTDPVGRILRTTYPDGTWEQFEYDSDGNLVLAANQDLTVTRVYDSEGRIASEQQGDYSVEYDYDLNGNRTRRSTSDGGALACTYDAANQVVSMVFGKVAQVEFKHEDSGRLTGVAAGNLNWEFSYGLNGQISDQRLRSSHGIVSRIAYEYDLSGNILRRSDALGEEAFVYDAMGRVRIHFAPRGLSQGYNHDSEGDLVTHRVESASGDTPWRRSASAGALRCVFDACGNLITRSDGNVTEHLRWNCANRLIETQNRGKSLRYGYDALGRRTFAEIEGRRKRFHWDCDLLIAEEEDATAGAAPSVSREFLYLPESFTPLAMVEESTPFYYFYDANGVPRDLVNSAGEIVWSGIYSALGALNEVRVNQVQNPLRLQGQYQDDGTALVYTRHRYYDPALGAFISRDPLGLAAGLNPYRFAPNVWNWIDPLGLLCLDRRVGRFRDPATGRFVRGRQVAGHFPLTSPGDRILFRRNPATGLITHFEEYNAAGLPLKRVDITGATHGGVPTPHVVEFVHNVSPTGQVFPRPNNWVRPAGPQDLI